MKQLIAGDNRKPILSEEEEEEREKELRWFDDENCIIIPLDEDGECLYYTDQENWISAAKASSMFSFMMGGVVARYTITSLMSLMLSIGSLALSWISNITKNSETQCNVGKIYNTYTFIFKRELLARCVNHLDQKWRRNVKIKISSDRRNYIEKYHEGLWFDDQTSITIPMSRTVLYFTTSKNWVLKYTDTYLCSATIRYALISEKEAFDKFEDHAGNRLTNMMNALKQPLDQIMRTAYNKKYNKEQEA